MGRHFKKVKKLPHEKRQGKRRTQFSKEKDKAACRASCADARTLPRGDSDDEKDGVDNLLDDYIRVRASVLFRFRTPFIFI
jgi:hypothetical protein